MARRLDEGEASAASGAAEERRRFVCPPARGRYEGIELEYLDPADPDAHRILLEAEHPELHRALRRGDDEVVVGGRPINPRLHIAMHEIVANQNLERAVYSPVSSQNLPVSAVQLDSLLAPFAASRVRSGTARA